VAYPLPTRLLVKGSNTPKNWPFDSQEFYFDPQPTAYPSGLVTAGVGKNAICVTLTTAQLLALNATAIQLANAPGVPPKGFGSSLVLLPTSLYLQYIFGGTAFTIGNADNRFQIEYTGKAVNLISGLATGLVDQAANTVESTWPIDAGIILAQANAANLGLEVKLAGTTPALTLGTGSVVLTLEYSILVLQ
jgi:hypothetical protein